MSLDPPTRERIDSLVSASDVTLFMKGVRHAPQCGFSATVVRILDTLIPEYQTVDVLQDPEIREGIKEYSSWPTIPQLYVKGEFIGGCDIIQELFGSGELQETLGVEGGAGEPPTLHVSPAAAAALREALSREAGPGRELHLSIDARFQTHLHLAPAAPGELEAEVEGLSVYLDPMSARRAEGLRIDVADTPQGRGFRIDNPNAPQVGALDPGTLKAWLDSREPLELVDVRTPEERATAHIEGSVLLTPEEQKRLEGLPRDRRLVFYCHHAGRSQAAAEHFAALGFQDVHNLVGGIDAWSQQVDPSVPRY